MTQPYSQQPLSQLVTQAIQRLVRHNPKVAIKKGARVAQLLIKDTPQQKLSPIHCSAIATLLAGVPVPAIS